MLAQGATILNDLHTMQSTLSAFNETKDWFDANAQEILAASRGARAELEASVATLQTIRPTLAASWGRQCAAVSEAAAQLRQETVAYEQQLAEMQNQGRRKAAAVEQSDMNELDALMKKPRSLKSS